MSVSTASKFPSIIIKGNKFFNEITGEQFFVKGIIHSPPYGFINDVLDDPNGCAFDGLEMKKKGFNVIHVWATDVKRNHSVCMKAYQDLGLYVLINLLSLDALDPGSKLWNMKKYGDLVLAIDNLVAYPNLLGFVFSDRLNTNQGVPAPNASYTNVKAAIRDLKLHLKENKYRAIPFGIGSSVSGPNSIETTYLLCGNMTEQKVDFSVQFLPSRCTLQNNIDLIKSPSVFDKYGIPLLLSDFTCDIKSSGFRNFTELSMLYGPELSNIWSGGTIYKYREDQEHLGMFGLKNGTNILESTFDSRVLEEALIKISPSSIVMSNYHPATTTYSVCSAVNKDWPIHSNIPATPRNEVCECMAKALSCVVGTSMSTADVNKQTEKLCAENPSSCLGVISDQTIGQYGAFSFCDAPLRLSWQLSIIHTQSTNSSQCGNDDIAQYVRSKEPLLDPECSTLMASAGTLGEKTINFEVFAAITSGPGVIAATPTAKSEIKATSSSPAETASASPVESRKFASGAIAGIVVGFAALLVLLLGLFLFWRRRQRSHSIVPQEEREVGTPPAYIRTELDSKSRKSELPASKVPSSSEAGPLEMLVAAEEEVMETPLSPSWANSEWYDPNDPRQGLTGSPVQGLSGNTLAKEVAKNEKLIVL